MSKYLPRQSGPTGRTQLKRVLRRPRSEITTFAVKYGPGAYIERNGQGGIVYQTTASQTFVNTRSKVGTSVPDWRSKIKAGVSATSDFDASVVRGELTSIGSHLFTASLDGELRATEEYSGGYLVLNSNSLYEQHTVYPDEEAAERMALTNFYRNLRKVRAEMSGFTFLGELRETVRMLRRPAQALRQSMSRYLDDLKKGSSRIRRRSRDAWVSRTYLEYTFGWSPLMNDISDIVSSIERLYLNKRYQRVRSVGFAEAASETNTNNSPAQVLNRRRVMKARTLIVYRGAIKAEAVRDASVKDVFGFRMEDFIPSAWNLLPWSFVADYFANIGDILEAATTDTSDLAWVQRTKIFAHEYRDEAHFIRHLYPSSGGWVYGGSTSGPDVFTINRKTVQRRAITSSSLGVPTLSFTLPGIKQDFNLAALGVQLASTRAALR